MLHTKRKKNFIITAVILGSILFPLTYYSWDMFKFAKGDLADSRARFDNNKFYIYKIGFKGLVMDKVLCEKCGINKYSLKIKLFQLSEKPNFGSKDFPPYYQFETDSVIKITVGKELFTQSTERDTIFKNYNSNTLKIRGYEIQYLNTNRYEWVP